MPDTPDRRNARSAIVHRRGLQRKPGAGRLGVHPPPSGHGQGTGIVRRGAGDDQQPHGNDGRDPRPGGAEARRPRGDHQRQHLRRQGVFRMDAQVEAQRLAAPRGRPSSSRSRTRSSGGRWTNCLPSIKSASRTFAGIKAIPKTSAATRWPWPRIRSTASAAAGHLSNLTQYQRAFSNGFPSHFGRKG